jgi:nucleotide-binding universal stress UspA family protein
MVNVLLAYDGSAPAVEALALALDQFDLTRLTALYVLDPTDTDAADHEAAARDRAADLLPAVERRVDDAVAVDTAHRVGDPAEEIVAHAESTDADHVVLGSHGREGMDRLLVGSVAEAVVRGSPVPVTVAR